MELNTNYAKSLARFICTGLVAFATSSLLNAQSGKPLIMPVDMGGDTVKLLSANITDQYVNGTASADAFKIDFAECDALGKSSKDDKSYKFDCSKPVSAEFGLPMAKRVYIDDAQLVRGKYVSATSYCSLFEVNTVVRASAVDRLLGIGFYIDIQMTEIPTEDLVEVERVILADGEEGVVYRFALVQRCTTAKTTAKFPWYSEFKPFALVTDLVKTTQVNRIWDDAIDNYKMFEEINKIDLTKELLAAPPVVTK